jgi:hypothetical protein
MSYNEFDAFEDEDEPEPHESFWTIVITTVLAGVGFFYALLYLAP